MSDPLPDGVFIGLGHDDYFDQPRLGSSDLTTLHRDPASWWYGSKMNPLRPEREPTAEMDLGSAFHALLLEGESAYAKIAITRPRQYFDAKTGRWKPWNWNANICKEWLAAHDPDGTLIVLTEDEDAALRHMTDLILNHPELGEPMRGGLSEVSVFWTGIDGVQMRARFDKLLPRFVIDLKTIGGDAQGRTVKEQCLRLVAQRDMDVQRFLYFQARAAMAGLIEAGHLHGGNDHDRDWIAKASTIDDWRWCWIFFRRRDDKRVLAPVVQPILRSHFDITFDTGRRKVEVALQNYLAFRERFGEVP